MKTHRPAPASVPHTGNIAQFSLDNGITLLVYENFASPAVIVSGYFSAGMRDESPLGTGLSGFMTDCLTRGTTRRSYAEIYDVTESIGASMGVSAGTHTSSLYAKSLAEDLPLMLDLPSSTEAIRVMTSANVLPSIVPGRPSVLVLIAATSVSM